MTYLTLLPGGPVPDSSPCIAGAPRPHPATDGLLCRHHFEELGTWLRDIQREAERLSAVPSMQSRLDGGGSSLASRRAPADLAALVCTDDRSWTPGELIRGPVCESRWCGHGSCDEIREEWAAAANGERILPVIGVLAYWAGRVRSERLFGVPARVVVDRLPDSPPGPMCDSPTCRHPSCEGMRWVRDVPATPTVVSERDLLTRQLDWIAGRPWAADFRREIRQLRRDLLEQTHNEDGDRDPLPGYCYKHHEGSECHGRLWPAEPVHTTGYETRDGVRAVECDGPGRHHFEGPDLARLKVIVDRQRLEAGELREVDEGHTRRPTRAAGPPSRGAGGLLAPVLEQQARDEAS